MSVRLSRGAPETVGCSVRSPKVAPGCERRTVQGSLEGREVTKQVTLKKPGPQPQRGWGLFKMGNRSLMLSLSRQARSGKWMRGWEPRGLKGEGETARRKRRGGAADSQPASSLWAASLRLSCLPGRSGDCSNLRPSEQPVQSSGALEKEPGL